MTRPLDLYVQAIADSLIGAFDAIEKRHPEWEVGAFTLSVKAVLRPETLPDKTVRIWADIDEGSAAQVSEIPIPVRRKGVK